MTPEQTKELFETFRAKCSELNLINEEMIAATKKRDALHDAYRERYDEFLEFGSTEYQAVSSQLVEIRSELQALQAQILDVIIDEMMR